MAVKKDYLLRALLKWNYFPSQKKLKEELPPVFTSSDLTKDIAEEVRDVTLSKYRKGIGFDSVQYYATRYNNVPRLLSIPHPKPYSELCLEIYNNWSNIKHICSNTNSLILPRKHLDKRTIIMDYESSLEKRNRYYKSAFGKKFIVNTDITNCYPSLYSHVLPWALVGISRAKRERNDHTSWFNKIDRSFRACYRNETAGLPIGPATSNIACEIILERIDRDLRGKFSYVRFIDDYTAYCETHTKAEKFIRDLSTELIKYKLNLNIKKTEIKSLPQAINEEWINRMREIIPQDKEINPSQVSNILDAAIILQKDNPDGSVLKYATNSIVEKLNDKSSIEFVKYAIKLCFYYPILIPTLNRPLETVYNNGSGNFKEEFLFLLDDSIEYRRSEAMSWLLYYLKVFHDDIPTKISKRIIECGDCMALTLLAEYPAHQKKVIDFAEKLDKTDLYELDTYWPLLYQLYLKGKISNPYSNDDTFKLLKKHNVSFVKC
jgi:hypothetical protein